MINPKYNWIATTAGVPKMILEAWRIAHLNTKEVAGAVSNREILHLAKVAGVESIYKSDETPWCAVAQSAIALACGKTLPFAGFDRLRAVSFIRFGTPVNEEHAMLGDVLIFKRDGGYHVGMYVAEDDDHFHVAGGNQSNQYSFCAIIEKDRLFAVRRPEYKIGLPAAVKKYFMKADGHVSTNEA